jgi:hypothetical protein
LRRRLSGSRDLLQGSRQHLRVDIAERHHVDIGPTQRQIEMVLTAQTGAYEA